MNNLHITAKPLPLHRFSRKALMIGLWCNGSTTGFGSVCPGSNPGSPTLKKSRSFLRDFFSYIPFYILPSRIASIIFAGARSAKSSLFI